MKSFLIVLLIISFFGALIYKFQKNRFHFFTLLLFALFVGTVIKLFVPLSFATQMLLKHLAYNLWLALLFLYALQWRCYAFWKKELGCSCTIGAKRYWIVVLMAFSASLFAQVLANSLQIGFIGSIIVALFLGWSLSFTKAKELGGAQEVANSMLFLFVAIVPLLLF